MEALSHQSRLPDQVILVDSGSQDPSYLNVYKNAEIILGGKDIGFCVGNNVGMQHLSPRSRYVLFLNPDAFLSPSFIQEALSFMEEPKNCSVGALTGILEGYDIKSMSPSLRYDSTGLFRTWYGRWYDRGQGKSLNSLELQEVEELPGICGALIFARREALSSIQLDSGDFFDSRFYMYKEDIDLSLRLRKRGWKLCLLPKLRAHHCRGWQGRKKMERRWRLLSARNEFLIQWRNHSCIGLFYAFLKYIAVKVFNI
jgi:GT2 family glycosyltransferase